MLHEPMEALEESSILLILFIVPLNMVVLQQLSRYLLDALLNMLLVSLILPAKAAEAGKLTISIINLVFFVFLFQLRPVVDELVHVSVQISLGLPVLGQEVKSDLGGH